MSCNEAKKAGIMLNCKTWYHFFSCFGKVIVRVDKIGERILEPCIVIRWIFSEVILIDYFLKDRVNLINNLVYFILCNWHHSIFSFNVRRQHLDVLDFVRSDVVSLILITHQGKCVATRNVGYGRVLVSWRTAPFMNVNLCAVRKFTGIHELVCKNFLSTRLIVFPKSLPSIIRTI